MKERLKEYLEKQIPIFRENAESCKKSKVLYARAFWLGHVVAFKQLDRKFNLGVSEKDNKEQEWIDGYNEWKKELDNTL